MNLHEAARKGALDDVQRLLSEGAEINSRDPDGEDFTPLMEAAFSGQLRVLQHLIQAGANLNLVDIAGYSALEIALSSNTQKSIKKAMVLALLHSGANPNIGKLPAVSITAFSGEPDLAAVCLAYGARQVHNSDVTINSETSDLAQTRKAFEKILNNPLSLKSLSIIHIRRWVRTDNLLKLPLLSRLKECCLNPYP